MKPLSDKPHDAGSHEQTMMPGVQAAIDGAYARGLLPPLPPPHTLSRGDEDGPLQLGYTADQMRAYAWLARQPIYSAEQAQIEAPLRAEIVRLQGSMWPTLDKPARVGNGTFQPGVSARLVVEAAQRQQQYAEEEGRLTDEQARQHERNRRKLWDMVNGPLCMRMSGGEPCYLRPPCPDCGRACHDVPEGA
jgi:hypothetical protein